MFLKNNIFVCLKFSIVILFGLLIIPSVSFAHSGGTDAYGCHTCRTNCPSYGLSYGEYHCHQSTGLPQPEDPIRSHYGEYGTGWTEPWPDYSNNNYYSSPSIPSCPIFSDYDSLSGSCKCIYGYVADNYGGCESGNSACHKKFGYNSSYKVSNKTCECDYGYVFDSNDQCVSKDSFCQSKLGLSSEYKILENSCGCKSGYVLNTSHTSCISGDTYCTGNFDWNSYYDLLDKSCKCKAGYEFSENKCVEIKISNPVVIPIYQASPANMPKIPSSNSFIQKSSIDNQIKDRVNKEKTNYNKNPHLFREKLITKLEKEFGKNKLIGNYIYSLLVDKK